MSHPKSVNFEKRAEYATHRHITPTKAFKEDREDRKERYGGLGLYLGYSEDHKTPEQAR